MQARSLVKNVPPDVWAAFLFALFKFDRYGAIAVQLDFEEPLGAIRQFRDGGAVHRFDELGFAFWKGTQPTAPHMKRNWMNKPKSQISAHHAIMVGNERG